MSRPLRWPFAAVLLASATLTCAAPVLAVPARPRLVEPVVPLVAPRSVRVAPAIHFVAAPLRFSANAALVTPIKALPLVSRPEPVRMLPMVLPRLGLATLLAPLGTQDCAGQRSPVLLAALPANPFTPITCEGRGSSTADGGTAPTSLVPGHNKNALYRSADSPHIDDGP